MTETTAAQDKKRQERIVKTLLFGGVVALPLGIGIVNLVAFLVIAAQNPNDRVADDFYKHAHRLIFSAIERLNERSDPVDIISVSEFLGQRETELEEIRGLRQEIGGSAKTHPLENRGAQIATSSESRPSRLPSG